MTPTSPAKSRAGIIMVLNDRSHALVAPEPGARLIRVTPMSWGQWDSSWTNNPNADIQALRRQSEGNRQRSYARHARLKQLGLEGPPITSDFIKRPDETEAQFKYKMGLLGYSKRMGETEEAFKHRLATIGKHYDLAELKILGLDEFRPKL